MGCNSCKDKKNGGVNENKVKGTKANVIGNLGIRIFMFVIGCLILPLTIPFMWYFLFNKLFFESKTMDLVPSIVGIVNWFKNRKNKDGESDDDDVNDEELELVKQIDEVK